MRLFAPLNVGPFRLPNRIVMAPMTRNRAGPGGVPGPLNAEYYRQRASAGLIITEGTPVSAQGVGYPSTPGIFTPEQIEGWRLVTDAVHEAGGRIFVQLWHCGRISHPVYHGGEAPVAPSAIAPGAGEATTPDGPRPFVTPRALRLEEIPGIVESFGAAAANARLAGFDGAEIHGANGYLLDQFLRDGTNRRTDAYGGAVENRARLLLEVTRAVVERFGPGRVGVRLSPSGTFNDMRDSAARETFGYAAGALDRLPLAYLHIVEAGPSDRKRGSPDIPVSFFRGLFRGPLMANVGYTRESAEAVLAEGHADLVSFGELFLANPDLPERFRRRAPLNPGRREHYYGGGAEGYVDYPALEEEALATATTRTPGTV